MECSSKDKATPTYKKKLSKIYSVSKNDTIKKLASELNGLEFDLEISNVNRNQFVSKLDSKIEDKLSKSQWEIISGSEVEPEKLDVYLNSNGSEKIGKLDLIIKCEASDVNVYIEIEKSNRLKFWNDFIKIANAIKRDKTSLGVVICPTNYSTRSLDRNLYEYAIKYKGFMGSTFNKSLMNRIHIIGYEQTIYDKKNSTYKKYDSSVVQEIKGAHLQEFEQKT